MRRFFIADKCTFQYMLLLRGATRVDNLQGGCVSFNTCSSCEEQLCERCKTGTVRMFQYMLLLRGATVSQQLLAPQKLFQYMLLLRGATKGTLASPGRYRVSIHAPLARSNKYPRFLPIVFRRFQYMLLLRGATQTGFIEAVFCVFQYMLLLRGATKRGRRWGFR